MTFDVGLTAEEYCELRTSVGWGDLDRMQVEGLICNSDYIVSCRHNREIVGSARVFWDKGYIAYLSDVMVKPTFQGKGVGKKLVQNCLDYIDGQLKPGWRIKVVILSSKGNEGFYQKIGFQIRPGEKYGCGMDMWRK